MGTEASKEPTPAEIMAELKFISRTVEGNSTQLDQLTHEMAGNGGPGVRTRLHSLEAGTERYEDRIEKVEETSARNEKQILSMRNIGAGLVLALGILEALRWIVPMLQAP